MIGIVTRVSSHRATVFLISRASVPAPFAEVHAQSATLEVGEIIECAVRRRENGQQFAADIYVLTGREEQIALAQIAAKAPHLTRRLRPGGY
jgi:hypothetical protein